MTNVFLSYARADAQTVERVARDLRSQGVEVWIDKQDLVAGEEWLPQIKKALLLADFVVVFISKASLNSKWVQEEYRAAFNALAGVAEADRSSLSSLSRSNCLLFCPRSNTWTSPSPISKASNNCFAL